MRWRAQVARRIRANLDIGPGTRIVVVARRTRDIDGVREVLPGGPPVMKLSRVIDAVSTARIRRVVTGGARSGQRSSQRSRVDATGLASSQVSGRAARGRA